jgi:transcription elongation factor Elf1
MKNEDKIATIAEPQEAHFTCTNCGARYKVIRVEGTSTMGDRELSCINCDEVLKAREDKFVLKYFLVGTQKRPKWVPGR